MLLSLKRGENRSLLAEGFIAWTVLAINASYKKIGDKDFRPFYDASLIDRTTLDAIRIDLSLRYESIKKLHVLNFNAASINKRGNFREDTIWKLNRLFRSAGVSSQIPRELIGKSLTFYTIKIEEKKHAPYSLFLSDIAGDDEAPKANMIDSIRMGLVVPHKTSIFSSMAGETTDTMPKMALGGIS